MVTIPSVTISSSFGMIASIRSAVSAPLDHDRQVLGEPQDAGGVQSGGCAEALDPPQHGGTGEAFLPQHLDDRLIQRLATVLVGLADEDPQQLALALELPSVLPRARPMTAAGSEDGDQGASRMTSCCR
jgi:hypothetical protein